jgi:streptomycin 6-kinase
VLKINFPHRESLSEPSALRHWDGNGAVGLLDEQEDMRALLLERCIPGEKLWDIPDLAATSEVIGVFERLWDRPAPDDLFEPLSSAAVSWAEHFEAILAVPRGPGERALVEGALMFLSTEPSGDRADVVLHQDLHGGNVLKRGSEWIAIDPKPLAGEREFDTASFIRDRRDELTSDPDAGSTVRRRIDILSEHLGLDRARVKGWALVHALAWGSDPAGELYPEHALAARLIAQA